MSRHHLPLCRAKYQFAKDIYRIQVKLPKILKNDLGQEAFASILKIVKCVALANRSQDKSRLIGAAGFSCCSLAISSRPFILGSR